MAKKKMSKRSYDHNDMPQRTSSIDNEWPFPSPQRPDNEWVYRDGMVNERPEFGSAPMRPINGQFPHYAFGVAGYKEHIEDGRSGMDRHINYILPEKIPVGDE
jgi:hypothetical protein